MLVNGITLGTFGQTPELARVFEGDLSFHSLLVAADRGAHEQGLELVFQVPGHLDLGQRPTLWSRGVVTRKHPPGLLLALFGQSVEFRAHLLEPAALREPAL